MTRERANELKEVFNAFCEGKEIELDTGCKWRTIQTPTFDNASNYRIKPTEEYRPYESTDEMIKDFNKRFRADSYVIRGGDLPLVWVRDKYNGIKNLIIAFDSTEVFIQDVWKPIKDLFADYEYLDGTKIGIKE